MSINLDNRTHLITLSNFYSAYSPHLSLGLSCPPESDITDQSFKDECDINTIMQRYQSTGELPQLNAQEGQWLDVTEMDFQEHMNFVIEAQAMFEQIPSHIRDRFGNDPGAFLGFCSDPANVTELATMGLLTPEATDAILYPPSPSPAPSSDPA